MDINAVKTGLATQAGTVTPALNAFGFVPDSIIPPCFFTGEVDIEYDKAFNRGLDELMVTCYILVGYSFSEPAQKLLDGYLKGSGPSSLKAAIEGTPGIPQTLGGACDDLHVVRVQAYRPYQLGGSDYVGAELIVRVIGSGT